MREKGLILQSRGLYQLLDVGGDANQVLAEATKLEGRRMSDLGAGLSPAHRNHSAQRVDGDRSKGPPASRRAPPASDCALRDKMLHEGIEEHTIAGVTVPMYSVPKTVVDLFRYRQSAQPQSRS
jgi:hypothetical protein